VQVVENGDLCALEV